MELSGLRVVPNPIEVVQVEAVLQRVLENESHDQEKKPYRDTVVQDVRVLVHWRMDRVMDGRSIGEKESLTSGATLSMVPGETLAE
jgi:hypothetical protein